MAASKGYYTRPNYQFLSGTGPISTDSMFEIDESDIWNVSTSPDFHNSVQASRISKKLSPATVKRSDFGGTASSLPVNVPDWSKILKQDYTQNRNGNDDFEEIEGAYGGAYGGACDWMPPHEFLARKSAGTRMASFSVHEGFGRTLKGRDLSRVRNAIWEKTGFQD